MSRYLITFRPMEPYFFGGERTFGFGRETGQKQPYYILSEKTPSQPTLFGTLRYIILAQNDTLILNTGEKRTAEIERANKMVGKESFLFSKANSQITSGFGQSFGIINNISPLFLIKDNIWYVRTPYNHNPGKKNLPNTRYTPFVMKNIPVISGSGSGIYPSDYKVKEGYGGGYVSLDDLCVIHDEDIFFSDAKTGINSHRTEDVSAEIKDDGSLFKKERWMLIEGFSFAIIADLSEDIKPGKLMVFMGQDKSPFCCEIKKTNEDLITKTRQAFSGKNQSDIKYALSDIMPVGGSFSGEGVSYYIADTKVMRNLESNMNADNYYGRLKKSEKLYKLMKAGSVFFTDKDFCMNEALRKIGMNVIISI